MIHTMTISLDINHLLYEQLAALLGVNEESDNVNQEYTSFGFREIELVKVVNRRIQYFGIDIRLNPAVLIENEESISVISKDDLNLIGQRFDHIMETIIVPNIKIPSFNNWKCKRIDYAVDIKTPNVSEYINLFKKGDRPSSFKQVDNREGSYYISSKSVTINFYDKQAQQRTKANGKESAIDKRHIEEAFNVLRFEIQCLKQKTQGIKRSKGFANKQIEWFLDPNISQDSILYYYDKTIGKGDFYSFNAATNIIEASNLSSIKKQKTIEVLKLIAQARSIYKAREQYVKGVSIKNTNPKIKIQGSKSTFKNCLKMIRELNINPITIPRDWNLDTLCNPRNQIIEKLSD